MIVVYPFFFPSRRYYHSFHHHPIRGGLSQISRPLFYFDNSRLSTFSPSLDLPSLSSIHTVALSMPRLFHLLVFLLSVGYGSAFLPYSPMQQSFCRTPNSPFVNARHLPVPVRRQRKSVASVQTMGLFGLGFLEIVVIVVAVGFLLGPEKIGELLRSGASTANEFKEELKNVPDEFKKGLEEGEENARARKAKPMQKLPSELKEAEKEE